MILLDYRRDDAVKYAHEWSFKRNSAYYDFSEIGGDCTNYASQCLLAGSGFMNYRPTFGWYYNSIGDRAPAWTGVPYFYNFLIGNKTGPGPFGSECDLGEVEPGDFVQLSFDGGEYRHTPIVVAVTTPGDPGGILVAAHSYDCDWRPLSTYIYAKTRCIKIEGVRRP